MPEQRPASRRSLAVRSADRRPLKPCPSRPCCILRTGSSLILHLFVVLTTCAGTPPTSEYVEAFKQMLDHRPRSGSVVFRRQINSGPWREFKAVWFDGDFAMLSVPIQAHSNAPAVETHGRWGGKHWEHALGTLTLFETPTAIQVAQKKLKGSDCNDEVLLFQLLACGVEFLPQHSLKWTANDFSVTLTTGTHISGTLLLDGNGRIECLAYRLMGTHSAFRITYGHEIALPLRIPNSFSIESTSGDKVTSVSTFRITDLNTPISTPQWQAYNPRTLFPAARLVIHSNRTYFLTMGSNLIAFATSSSPAATERWPRRITILVMLVLAAPFLYALIKRLHKEGTETRNQ